MTDIRTLRSLVLAHMISGGDTHSPDKAARECVYVIGRRIREIRGSWPFSQCTGAAQEPSPDFYLSFADGGLVDPRYGYGPEAYLYCKNYLTPEGEHR